MRCDFIKEKHLIRAYAIYTAYSNDSQKLNEEFAKAFNNPEIAMKAVMDMIAGGTTQVPPASSYTDTTVNMDMIGNIAMPNTDAENVQASYVGGIGFMRMQSKFRRSLLGASVLNVDSMTYIDPDEIISGHKLNRISENILTYKNKLLRTIASEMGITFTDITEDATYQQYTDAVNNILTQFGNYVASHYSSNLENSDAYDSYIILKNFDKLVKNYAPYIKVDSSFENKFEDVNKYSFQPSVKHRHHFTKTDNSDITKQVGNLAETLLKVIPDIDASNNPKLSSVGVAGFNGAMQTLKKAVMYDNVFEWDEGVKFRKSIMRGAATLLDPNNDYNLAAMIQKFIAKQSRRGKNSGFSEFRQTYLHNKLRGIQQYLFADTTPEYIKNSFCQLFLKTEATGYRAYTYDRDADAFKGKELRSKMYSTQRYAFQSVISGGLKSIMSKTRVAAKGILSKYDIKIHTENGYEFIYITNKATKQKAKLSCANLAASTIETDTPSIINDFMKDVYSYYIPNTYENCMTNEIGYNWGNDFAPFIAIAAKEALRTARLKYGNYTELNLSRGKVDLAKFNANLNNIGQRLSVIFGDSIRSTTKSLEGNSLPLFGQTSLEYNWRTCLDNAMKLPKNEHNMQYESLFWENSNMLLAPQVRSEVELNGQIKDPARMNLNELNRVSILDDFWFPSRESSAVEEAIWLQNATFSDKARHFLVGYKLAPELRGKHVIDVYGKETSLKEMIDDAVKNGNDKMLEMTRRIRRDKYVAAVSKILSGYAQVYPEWEIDSKAIENETDREAKAQFCVVEFNKLDQKLKDSGLSTTDIRNAFIAKGVTFEEHVYAYKPAAKGLGEARVNETMKHYLEAATDKTKWQEMMDFNQTKFGRNLQSLVLSGFDKGSGHQVKSLLRDKIINARLENHDDYYNKATKEYKLVTKDGKLHPVAEAYFAADILLSQEYNSLTIGEIWAHPNKNKEGLKASISEEEYYNNISKNQGNFIAELVKLGRQPLISENTLTKITPIDKQLYKSGITGKSRNYIILRELFKFQSFINIKSIDELDISDKLKEEIKNAQEKFKNTKAYNPISIIQIGKNEAIIRAKEFYNLQKEYTELITKIVQELYNIDPEYTLSSFDGKNEIKTYTEFIETDPESTYNTYLEYSEANRLVNQVKRSVIFGSTIHPFGIGTKDEFGYYNGVTSEIDIAIIEDMKGKVFTPLGVDGTVDSQDGSGLCTALQARLENNSEVDAAVGDNKKTIVHSINPETGTATLLKWAVYALTNNVRRNGAGSKANVESLVKRMYDKALGRNDLDLNQIYRDYADKNGQIYIKNRISGEYKELANIRHNIDGTYTQIFTDGTIGRTIAVNTLYDIDQVFGGAWTYKFDGNNYIGTEASVDLLAAAAIKYDLRDKQIAYAVNGSACKVGATNVNSSDAWTNDAKLSTYKISMQFAGVMMNADHDLEEAEVTEMSQMISALIEDGHYTDLVTSIYSEIGQIALNNSKIQKVIEAAKSGDRNKMAQIVGESLVRSFSTGSKDTIGLAQAFVKRTARELKKNGYSNYNLPFDDPTIWGAVVADVTSTLSKLGVRRKYEGFAGVLNPSHNMIQYYLTPKGAMVFDQFENLCRDVLKTLITVDPNAELIPATGFDGTTHYYASWADAARSAWMFGTTRNPFLQPVTNSHDIDFEDTVVIIKNGIPETMYVDDFATYDALRNLNALDGAEVYKNTASPRNLRGADTKFTVNSEDGTQIGEYSLYDIDSVRAAHYLGEMEIDPGMISSHIGAILQQQEIGKATPKDLADLPKLLLIEKVFKQLAEQGLSLDIDGCNILTQNFLEQLDFGKHRAFTLSRGEALTDDDNDALFGAQECFGGNWGDVRFYASNYETRPAEIIMGRYQMEKLGLSISDNLVDIKNAKFFYDKLKAKYNYSNIEPSISGFNEDDYVELYDRTLFINGEPVFVKVGEISDTLRSKLDISINTDANIIGEDVRIGNEIILSDDKGDLDKRFRFEKIQTSSGLISYITVQNAEDLKKLTNSEYFDDIYTDKKEDYAKFDKRLQRMAKDRYTSFKHGIEFVGARIPTQAMQSFMPFRVIAFNDSEQNAVYVPKANTHIEGSDYDKSIVVVKFF